MQIHDLVLLLQLAAAPVGKAEPPPPPQAALAAPEVKKPSAEAAAPAADEKKPPVAAASAEKKPADDADEKKADEKKVADAPAAAAGDDDEDAPEAEEQSAEMEELRALEAAALDPKAKPSAEVFKTMYRLGLGNPLRRELEDACEEPELIEDPRPGELPQITDLANFDVGLVKDEYDIPVEIQPLVVQYIQFFQGPGRKWFRHWMSRSTRYIPLMQPILEQHGLPKDTVYLAMIESGFSVQATSWARAVGPWQFITGTAKMMGLRLDFWVDERRDPIKSTAAAARYLGELHEDLGHWYLAWAGYNTGGGRVRKMMEVRGTSDFWALSEGKGFAKETKHYVPKLIACALVAKHYKAFGFSDDEFNFEAPLEFDEVKVVAPTDLDVIARAAGVSVEQVRDLNPELRRWCTPPASDAQPYMVRIPKGTAITFAQNFPKVAPQERLTFKIHKVKKGDTLSKIALEYHSAPEAILQFNRLRNVRGLRINTELAIPVPSARSAKAGVADAVMERQVAKARRAGYVATRPEEEIPAGTPPRKAKSKAEVATGQLKSEHVNGKTRISYGVQEGDSLWSICQQYGCSVDDLRKWNELPKRTRGLQVGTVLAIWQDPAAKSAQTATGHGGSGPLAKDAKDETPVRVSAKVAAAAASGKKTHQLLAGETLWSVAQRYGVKVDDLMRWNGITNHRAVRAGQLLLVSR